MNLAKPTLAKLLTLKATSFFTQINWTQQIKYSTHANVMFDFCECYGTELINKETFFFHLSKLIAASVDDEQLVTKVMAGHNILHIAAPSGQ